MLGRSMGGRIYQQRPFKPARVNLRHNPEKQRTLQYPIPGDSSFQPQSGRKHYNPRGSIIHDLIFNQDLQQMNKLKSQFQNQYGSLSHDKKRSHNYLHYTDKNSQYKQQSSDNYKLPHKIKQNQLNFQKSVINQSYKGEKQFHELGQNYNSNINNSQVSSSNGSQYNAPYYFSPTKNSGIIRQQSMNQILKPFQLSKSKNPHNYELQRNNSFNYGFKDQIDQIKLKKINPSFLSAF